MTSCLNPCGIYKERLSQSALLAAMRLVTDEEADQARTWLDQKGMTFHTGTDEATELTDTQIREQLKMYIAAARLADLFGCDAIGIQYQQGLKDMAPGLRPGGGIAQQRGAPAGLSSGNGRGTLPRESLASFQRSR